MVWPKKARARNIFFSSNVRLTLPLSVVSSVCLSICPFDRLSVCHSVYFRLSHLSICPSVFLSPCSLACLSLCPIACLVICLIVHLSDYLLVKLSICPNVCLSNCLLCLTVCPTVCLSFCLFVRLSVCCVCVWRQTDGGGWAKGILMWGCSTGSTQLQNSTLSLFPLFDCLLLFYAGQF